jgi:hypothetical protein
MKTYCYKYIFLGSLLLAFISCAKNAQPPLTPPPVTPVTPPTPVVTATNCKITGAYVVANGDTSNAYTFTYYDDGRMKTCLNSAGIYSDTVSFTYNGKTIYRSVAAGINSSVDTNTINDSGMVVHNKEVIFLNNFTGISDWVYDANQQLKTFTQSGITTNYFFTNGDNTLNAQGIYQDTLLYDLSKPAVMGNEDWFNQIMQYGAMFIKNKHLIATERHGNYVTFTYTFRPDGNIASTITTAGNYTSTKFYTYDCK